MPRTTRVNTIAVATKQIWEHITSHTRVLVLAIENDMALCALLADGGDTRKRVRIPVLKFVNRGNRGFVHIETRKGSMPKAKWDGVAVYEPRKYMFGAE